MLTIVISRFEHGVISLRCIYVHPTTVMPTSFAITRPSIMDGSSDSNFLTVVLCSLLLTVVYKCQVLDMIYVDIISVFDTRLNGPAPQLQFLPRKVFPPLST
jgi:hypothetical protein